MAQSDLVALIDRLVELVESLPVGSGQWHVEKARSLSESDLRRFLDLDADLYAEADKHGLAFPESGNVGSSGGIGWTRLNEIGRIDREVDGAQKPTTYVVEIETWRWRLDLLRRRAEQVQENGGDLPPDQLLANLSKQQLRMVELLWNAKAVRRSKFEKHVWPVKAPDKKSVERQVQRLADRFAELNVKHCIKINDEFATFERGST